MEREEGNAQVLYRGYIVAVLDVLGQKEAIRRLAKIEMSPENQTQLIDGLSQSFGTRNSVQSLFQLLFEKHPYDLSQPHIQMLGDPQKATLYRYTERQLKTCNFADTMIAYTPVLTSQDEPSLHDIYGILSGCAGTMLSSIADCTPVRGWVEIGYGLERQETVSPAITLSKSKLDTTRLNHFPPMNGRRQPIDSGHVRPALAGQRR